MLQFISSAVIVVGVLAASLKLLDWFLLKNQKEWIRDKATTVWIWLSYQRALPLLRGLEKKPTYVLALIFAVCFPIVANVILLIVLGISQDLPFFFIAMVVTSVACFFIGRRALSQIWNTILGDGRTDRYFLRAGLCFLISIFLAYFLSEVLLVQMERDSMSMTLFGRFVFPILGIVFNWVALVAAWMAFVILVYAICVYALIIVFKIFQAITLRVVESESGPVLAVAALLTAIGGIAKAFVPS